MLYQVKNTFLLAYRNKIQIVVFCAFLLVTIEHINAQGNNSVDPIRKMNVSFECDSLIVNESVLHIMDSVIFCANVVDTVWWFGHSIYDLFTCFNLYLNDSKDDSCLKFMRVCFNTGIEYSDGITGYFKMRDYYVYVHNSYDWEPVPIAIPDCFVRSGVKKKFSYTRCMFVSDFFNFEMGDDDIPAWAFSYKDGDLFYLETP